MNARKIIIGCLLSLLIVLVFFSPYITEGKVLFPGNLQVSTYSPWIFTPDPRYPNGPANKPIGFDNIRQFFPNRVFAKESFVLGTFPLWNPYILSGTPQLGAFDTAAMYPLHIIFQFLPSVDAWSIMVMIQPILSLWFMYLFLRSLDRQKMPSLLASLAYACSGWMIVYWEETLFVQHSFLWLPLALYGSNCIWKEKYGKGMALLILSLTFSILAGFFQMSIYVFATVVIWNCYRIVQARKSNNIGKKIKRILFAVAVSCVISCMMILPGIEAYIQSPRTPESGIFLFKEHLAPWSHIITLIAPDFWGNPGTYNYFGGKAFYFEKVIYVGILPLIFFLYGMIFAKQTHLKFWKYIGVIAFLLGFASPLGWLPYVFHIPILSSSYPTRIFAVSLFAWMVVCAYGIESYAKNSDVFRMRKIFFVLGVVLCCMWMIVGAAWFATKYPTETTRLCLQPWIQMLCQTQSVQHFLEERAWYGTVSLRNCIVPTVFFFSSWLIVVLARVSKKLWYGLCFFSILLGSYYFSYKYLYFSERSFVFPKNEIIDLLQEKAGYDRIWGYGNAFFEKNITQYYHLFSTDGYAPLLIKEYVELLGAIQHGGTLSASFRRSDADIFAASEKEALGKGNPYRLRIMSLLGVRYIVEVKKGQDKDHKTEEDRFPRQKFSLFYEDDTWRIWEYNDALPRTFFVNDIKTAKNKEEMLAILYNEQTNLRRTMVVSDAEIPILKKSNEKAVKPNAVVEIVSYNPEKIILSVDTDQSGAVFISDTYYPGWQAFVDGKETPIMRANYAFRAVPVDTGSHEIVFVYRPKSFIMGTIVSGIGILMAVFSLWYCRRN